MKRCRIEPSLGTGVPLAVAPVMHESGVGVHWNRAAQSVGAVVSNKLPFRLEMCLQDGSSVGMALA